MPILSSSKHEHFAQLVAKGVSLTKAYVESGYSKAGANTNASRLIANDLISARIKELQTVIAERVVTAEVRRRSWRVQVLQSRIDKMLALSESRARMYADSKSEGHRFQVHDRDAERLAIEEGCTVL